LTSKTVAIVWSRSARFHRVRGRREGRVASHTIRDDGDKIFVFILLADPRWPELVRRSRTPRTVRPAG